MAVGAYVVAENVAVGPAGNVETRAGGQKIEAGLGQFHAPFALEPRHQHFAQAVEEANVRSGIVALRFAELRGAPVARLLLLGNALAEQFLDQVLEAVAVGIGPHQLAGDLGAEHRRCDHAEVILDRREIESREVVELEPGRIGQHGLEVGRIVGAAIGEADEVFVTLPVADLQEAEAVPGRHKPHGLGIDGYGPGGEHAFGQVFFVEMYGHGREP